MKKISWTTNGMDIISNALHDYLILVNNTVITDFYNVFTVNDIIYTFY